MTNDSKLPAPKPCSPCGDGDEAIAPATPMTPSELSRITQAMLPELAEEMEADIREEIGAKLPAPKPCSPCGDGDEAIAPVMPSVEAQRDINFWQEVHSLLEPWRKIWQGDKAAFENKYPSWITEAAAELFAHDMCDQWNWNAYVLAASVIISRHADRALEPLRKEVDHFAKQNLEWANRCVALTAQAKELAEALEKAIPRLSHSIKCMKCLSTEHWQASGSWVVDNCVCGIAELEQALSRYWAGAEDK